ncbi:hypothetical protein [Agrococcus jejuensis]|uniref:Uncharacterized protein n=1 Tax=Agrococcus jejuensis TaxID=399736 RepID=A0A1G8BTN5_9MICO|nr:hypothetical protein [Agrococcus jejuensis]SDH36463.1 hypothetical protein SAMN04489720_1049 [Agrococcus jejuensis]
MGWFGGMERSRDDREIERLEGRPGRIMQRGTEIRQLGETMTDSAAVLQSLADGTHGLKGKAVEKLIEGVGSSHGTLKEAGELYTPTGPVVWRYGFALSQVQEGLNDHVTNCETLWQTYEDLPGDKDGRGVGGFLQPDEGSDEAKSQQAEDDAKQEAYDAWLAEADLFDDDYDTWETAFEQAADDIGTALAGKIKDSRWDDLDGFVAGALTVLKWAGVVLMVAALVIGGPIIGALAAVVAIATLVLTLYQKSRGDAGWGDVIGAAIGVIPFGSLSKLGSMKFMDDVAGGLLTGPGRSAIRTEMSVVLGSGKAAFRHTGSMSQGLRNSFSHFARNHGTEGRFVDIMARLHTGKDMGKLGSMQGLDIFMSTQMTMLGRLNTGLGLGTGEGLYARLFN